MRGKELTNNYGRSYACQSVGPPPSGDGSYLPATRIETCECKKSVSVSKLLSNSFLEHGWRMVYWLTNKGHRCELPDCESELMQHTSIVNAPKETLCFERLSEVELRRIVATYGTDTATKMLLECVRDSAQHRDAIRHIDHLCEGDVADDVPSIESPLVVIVPGFLYREYPESGADGRMLIEATKKLGWEYQIVDILSTGRLHVNGRTIVDWLKLHATRPTVIASISKGGSDIVCAMQQLDAEEAFRHVVGWVDVCGILRGSPVVDVVSRKWLTMLGFRSLFFVKRWCFESVIDLRRDGGPLASSFTPPPHMNIVHVVGFPQESDFVQQKLCTFHGQIGSLGPNDGAILLYDSLTAPGVVYPVEGADHYMRPKFRVQKLCQGLLRFASQPQPTR